MHPTCKNRLLQTGSLFRSTHWPSSPVSYVRPCICPSIRPSVRKKFLQFQWYLAFTMGAGNWPRILKLWHNIQILSGRIFDIYPSFGVTWLWTWHKRQLWWFDHQSRTGLIYLVINGRWAFPQELSGTECLYIKSAGRGCRLHKDVIARSSPLMLSSFLLSLFAGIEVAIRDEELYCDALCEQGPVIAGKQVLADTFFVRLYTLHVRYSMTLTRPSLLIMF